MTARGRILAAAVTNNLAVGVAITALYGLIRGAMPPGHGGDLLALTVYVPAVLVACVAALEPRRSPLWPAVTRMWGVRT